MSLRAMTLRAMCCDYSRVSLSAVDVAMGMALLVVFCGGLVAGIFSNLHKSGAQDDPAGSPLEVRPAYKGEPLHFVEARRRMVVRDLHGRNINDARVLSAMGQVARQTFVPASFQDAAYQDRPLPIGQEQTISQPYVVAWMTQLVKPKPDSRALDIGTGSGYQAAILSKLCREVISIEIIKTLAEQSKERLEKLGYDNVTVLHGDGYRGWNRRAPYDVIVVAAAPDHVPQSLVDQLAPGGRMVIPVGRFYQELVLIEKLDDSTIRQRKVTSVAFVPMTGEAQSDGTRHGEKK
jgi:protein-L-isoaspartate(D-aspartate) O-methyltransferase